MRQGKYSGAILSLVLLIGLILPSAVFADGPDNKFDATDVKIMKKVGLDARTLKGKIPNIRGYQKHDWQADAGSLISPLPPGGKRYAILTGISDYPGEGTVLQGGPDLYYADNDAVDMQNVLIGVYGFDPAKIKLLMGPNDLTNPENAVVPGVVSAEATRKNILRAINDVKRKATSKDEVVFHFSGHAAQGMVNDRHVRAKESGIVPCDVNLEEPAGPDSNIIWDRELKSAFSGFEANRIVFLFDMCFAGGMTDLQGQNRIVLMSTGAGGIAVEYGPAYYSLTGDVPLTGFEDMANGVFTYLFAKAGIAAGYADLPDFGGNGDGKVTVEEAFSFAKNSITEYSDMILYMLEQFGYTGLTARDETPVMVDRFRGDLLP